MWPNPHVGGTYLPQLFVGLLDVGGLPQRLVGVQVLLALRCVAVRLLGLRVIMVLVRLLVVLVPLPVRLVGVQVRVFELLSVVEPAFGSGCGSEPLWVGTSVWCRGRVRVI